MKAWTRRRGSARNSQPADPQAKLFKSALKALLPVAGPDRLFRGASEGFRGVLAEAYASREASGRL